MVRGSQLWMKPFGNLFFLKKNFIVSHGDEAAEDYEIFRKNLMFAVSLFKVLITHIC